MTYLGRAAPMLTAWQGVAGNLGMYAMGIPTGLLTDARGPRFITVIGAICLALGYYPIHLGAFECAPDMVILLLTVHSIQTRSRIGPGYSPLLFCFLDGYRRLLCLWGCYQDLYG